MHPSPSHRGASHAPLSTQPLGLGVFSNEAQLVSLTVLGVPHSSPPAASIPQLLTDAAGRLLLCCGARHLNRGPCHASPLARDDQGAENEGSATADLEIRVPLVHSGRGNNTRTRTLHARCIRPATRGTIRAHAEAPTSRLPSIKEGRSKRTDLPGAQVTHTPRKTD